MQSLNEICSEEEGDELVYDQPCRHGRRCGSHAVYCQHKIGPTKCCHTWYWGRSMKSCQDEDCELFAPNPDYKEGN